MMKRILSLLFIILPINLFGFNIGSDFIGISIDLNASQFIKGDYNETTDISNGISIVYDGYLDFGGSSTGGGGFELTLPNTIDDRPGDDDFYFFTYYLCYRFCPFSEREDNSFLYFPLKVGINIVPGGRIYYGSGIGYFINEKWKVELRYDEYWGREDYDYIGGNVDIRHKRTSLMLSYRFK